MIWKFCTVCKPGKVLHGCCTDVHTLYASAWELRGWGSGEDTWTSEWLWEVALSERKGEPCLIKMMMNCDTLRTSVERGCVCCVKLMEAGVFSKKETHLFCPNLTTDVLKVEWLRKEMRQKSIKKKRNVAIVIKTDSEATSRREMLHVETAFNYAPSSPLE